MYDDMVISAHAIVREPLCFLVIRLFGFSGFTLARKAQRFLLLTRLGKSCFHPILKDREFLLKSPILLFFCFICFGGGFFVSQKPAAVSAD